MPTVEEIREGIQEKVVEREKAVKKMWKDIGKKRKEIENYIKKFQGKK